jgi:hypothetical protein
MATPTPPPPPVPATAPLTCQRSYFSQDAATPELTAVRASVDEAFAIVFPAPQDPGASWSLVNKLDNQVIALVGKAFKSGAPSEEVWLFKALGPGAADIVMRAGPPTDPTQPRPKLPVNPSAPTVTFSVTVVPQC